ncbi:PREDICTED: uncharacterized protein LOC109581930 [Paramuricea clavata]|uniref:PREDICTED: uncharacterized protein LOC109581930 n=1 Tax=Paramuricea clavata TaxID=317549 RepID=A0A6S7FZM0_PARCT|nr:PREDICTED: uncharacterized protein LOC109581930 [Paramuricea clavata]
MKKRVCRHHCKCCGINFETSERFSIHLASRAHFMQGLQTPADDIQLVSDNNITLFVDAEGFQDRSLVPDTTEQNLVGLESPSDEENPMDMDGFSDTSDAEVDGKISLTTCRNQEHAYFPFPAEIFFLLYSYAHNISRPKTCTDLEFLWMISEKIGVDVPSLNSILNFTIEGVDKMLQPQKLAIPEKVKSLARYPEETDDYVYEMNQGIKWLNDKEFQTSSITLEGKHYYINDIVQFSHNGDLFMES